MQRAPALCGLVRFAGVQADLETGRAAHHPWAVRAEALEGVFHRGVARDGEDAARCAEGVQAVVARNEVRRTGLVLAMGILPPDPAGCL